MEGSRRYFVGGNWKCNGTVEKNRELITDVINKLEFDPTKVDVVVAPVSLHIAMAKVMLQDNVKVACQNISMYGTGAFTGEIAAEQLVDFGVEWTLIGHSERRTLFHEDNETVAKKVSNAMEAGLNVILCIGETLDQRENGTTNDVLKAQLDTAKDSIKDWNKLVIAYEPVWAIGTGKVATPAQAQETHNYIRSWIKDNVSEATATATRIIYGGSVNEKNCKDLISLEDLDGFLVGGASLKKEFHTIVDAASTSHA
uniref:Triosephosphate isomerase n=1 Tax=Euplotes harpa TaxID=151035 RepID=A0A7S3N760_9SPIT